MGRPMMSNGQPADALLVQQMPTGTTGFTFISTVSSLCGHRVSEVVRAGLAIDSKRRLEAGLCPDCKDVRDRCQALLDADGVDCRLPG